MSAYLHLRIATRQGGFLPPRTGSVWFDQPRSASRRHESAVNDRLRARNYVQLAPGVLVVFERQPWRVVETAERPLDLWEPEYEKRFAAELAAWERGGRGEKPERATWRKRPVTVLVVPANDPKAKPLHLGCPASHSWTVLPEHYSVCVACGELPPCSHELAEREADQQMARAEVLMDIPAGHCLGCGEAITPRMRAERFPGPNLWRPDLGDDSAVFHARRECANAAYRYRQQWKERGGQEAQEQLPLEGGAREDGAQ